MDLSKAIRKRLINLMEMNNLNTSKLSTLAGISRSTLTKILKGERKYIRLDILEYICEALNMKLVDFFNDKIFDNINIED